MPEDNSDDFLDDQIMGLKEELIIKISKEQKASNGLKFPLVDVAKPKLVMPLSPHDFINEEVPHVEAVHLKNCNQHERDQQLQFIASTHKYLIGGVPTLGSVTGLIHHFAEEFEPDSVIKKMTRVARSDIIKFWTWQPCQNIIISCI